MSVRSPKQLLINSASPKANEIGHELNIIKSNFEKEIAALKSAVSGDISQHHRQHASSFTSSSYTSMGLIRKVSSESIKSAMKWNEKKAEISCDDKFSTIIDDGADLNGERSDRRKRLMMKQEINNALTRNYNESIDANESIRDTSHDTTLPQQDESSN